MKNRLRLAVVLREMLLKVNGISDCRLTGSLVVGGYDEYSSVDFIIVPEKADTLEIMPDIMQLLFSEFEVVYTDHMVVDDHCTMIAAVSEEDPFLIVRLQCAMADEGRNSICWRSQQEVVHHLVYLWLNCCKHYLRGKRCMEELIDLVAQIPGIPLTGQGEQELLLQAIRWLQGTAGESCAAYLNRCGEILMNGRRKRCGL